MSTNATTYRIRGTITSKRFAEAEPSAHAGRPITAWVLVTGRTRLAVYNAEKGGLVIEGDTPEDAERRAYAKAQTVGKRMGLKLRAIPLSRAFYSA